MSQDQAECISAQHAPITRGAAGQDGMAEIYVVRNGEMVKTSSVCLRCGRMMRPESLFACRFGHRDCVHIASGEKA